MPTYAYRCDHCGVEFEKFQSITANPLRKCPQCGTFKIRRLIGTGAGIIFKGSGFYQTDYRSESYKDAAKKDKPAESKDSKDSTAKKDKVPASTSTSSTSSTETKDAKKSA